MKNMSSRILRAVAIGHIAIGALLLPAVLAFGGIFAPILIVGPIWGIARASTSLAVATLCRRFLITASTDTASSVSCQTS